ncbi:hypothetical protein BC941DRAFT_377162 [Chlamydoabsidia padenii]|nr:hypothetical protein BC941DRAFT_377162 [Chlamydoabsidia padenii]
MKDTYYHRHEISVNKPEEIIPDMLTSLDVSGDSIVKAPHPMKFDHIFKDRPPFPDKCCSPSTNLSSSSSSTLPPPSFSSYFPDTKKQGQQQQQQQQQQQKQQQQQYHQPIEKLYDEIDLQLIYSHQTETETQQVYANEKTLDLYDDSKVLPIQDELRFTYYHADTGRLHGKTLFDLETICDNHTSLAIDDLLTKENYWLDITSPTPTELHALAQAFGIHPLTIEDIAHQEAQEKCDSFRNYLFVSYRAFIHDDQALIPISFYNVIFKQYLITIHFGKVPHVDYVRQRVEQLKEYIMTIPDWINYAIVDEVTDSFAPLIHQIENEVESLDNIVLCQETSTPKEQTEMVSRIGFCRKRVMQMLRLLSSKSDVIRDLIKRYEERSGQFDRNIQQQHHHHHHHEQQRQKQQQPINHHFTTPDHTTITVKSPTTIMDRLLPSIAALHQDVSTSPTAIHHPKKRFYSHVSWMEGDDTHGQVIPDVGLYLGDVQDHIITMLQNLNHYETLLARTHANYLAKISIELSKTSNLTNVVIGRLTIFATIIVPMNLVTGIWGMNVKVPGGDFDNLAYFFWIVCCLAGFAVLSLTLARRWNLL